MKLHPLFLTFAALPLLPSACRLSDDASGVPQGGRIASSVAGAGGSDEAAAAGASSSDETPEAGGSSIEDGAMLPQAANPIRGKLNGYREWLSSAADAETQLSQDQARADNIISWQMPHGGFYKNDVSVYAAAWNGTDSRSGWSGADGVELGTIDNDATVTELLFLADVYGRSGDARYQESAQKGLDFLLGMQYPSGAFPQVYPARTGTTYSNLATFNDDAMIRVMLMLQQAVALKPPLEGELFTTEQLERAEEAVAAGVQFILDSQIEQDGVKSVWCAQHDPETFEPMGARSYELPSKSGKESASVVAFLMTQAQTSEIQGSVRAAINWFDSDDVKVADTTYVSRPSGSSDDDYNPIQPSAGSTMWYRFYDLDQDEGFFSGRLPTDDPPGVGKQYDIMEIEPERRYGYQWGGPYGQTLVAYARSVGY